MEFKFYQKAVVRCETVFFQKAMSPSEIGFYQKKAVVPFKGSLAGCRIPDGGEDMACHWDDCNQGCKSLVLSPERNKDIQAILEKHAP